MPFLLLFTQVFFKKMLKLFFFFARLLCVITERCVVCVCTYKTVRTMLTSENKRMKQNDSQVNGNLFPK